MSSSHSITPMAWKDRPALIEQLFPVQKLSAESYKEQMAVSGKTLTALGSFWKGRKPLILNKACVLGCLLPVTDNPSRDLEIFEMLMGMDDASLRKRLRLRDEQTLPEGTYSQKIGGGKRPEEIMATVHTHIWPEVNAHLGTQAESFPELVEQMGILRFGHRPRVADTFCGSGQIPFEAARLGCDVYASDLNPIACMLTWGAFNIVGGSPESREQLRREQEELVQKVQAEIDELGIETDGNGWRGKVYLYCLEVKCPETGWIVPLLPTFIVSKGYKVIAELVPDKANKRYDIEIRSGVSNSEIQAAEKGTVRSDGRGQESYIIHPMKTSDNKITINMIRGDYTKPDGSNGNRLRQWEQSDFQPRPDDIFQERIYCVQWMRPTRGTRSEYEFRAVTPDDLKREQIAADYVQKYLAEWQDKGFVPDMLIEPGDKTDEPIRTRGWTYWHHLFNARQLLTSVLTVNEILA